jgi:hypothetical protein
MYRVAGPLKSASTVRSEFPMSTRQAPAGTASQPFQPANRDPEPAAAVNVSQAAPVGKDAWHGSCPGRRGPGGPGQSMFWP